jgi:hypothetical protein
LPLPDSPTTATTSPRWTSKDTSLTARITPSVMRNSTLSPSISSSDDMPRPHAA